MRFITTLLLAIAAAMFASACSRTRYRMAADRDSYGIIQEKANCIEKPIDSTFSVRPDTRSRFYDPSNPDCPSLPVPRPELNAYQLPPLASDSCKDPLQQEFASVATLGFSSSVRDGFVGSSSNPSGTVSDVHTQAVAMPVNEPGSRAGTVIPAMNPIVSPDGVAVQPANFQPSVIQSAEGRNPVSLSLNSANQPQAPAQDALEDRKNNASNRANSSAESKEEKPSKDKTTRPRSENATPSRVTIPAQAWEVLPRSCLDRMMEFETLRTEYLQSFPDVQEEDLQGQHRVLNLANLMELATINSREYQSRKELLFRAALALTRQRYRYQLNPSPFGNGIASNYRHQRTNGITENRLAVPSGIGVEQSLATGGEFLARFANSVVLTFNGPSGFAADIGSELVFDFQQTLFQRDVRFESLTQAERDVVYATRDYLRFRKQLFRDISGLYYNLLLNYRGIEINAQDYFTNLRGFIQTQTEYRTAEKFPRIQVDQFEQTVLRARSNLVNNCFALEAALDQLKFRLGLPTEMSIYLDLMELESISLRDELSVARQMIRRARTELLIARNTSNMDTTTLANVAEVLADRMGNILRIQQRMERASRDISGTSDSNASLHREGSEALVKASNELLQLQQLLQILGLRMQVDILRSDLEEQRNSATPAPPLRVLIRAIESSTSEIQIVDLAIESVFLKSNKDFIRELQQRKADAQERLNALTAFMEKISSSVGSESAINAMEDFAKIPDRMKDSIRLVEDLEKLAKDATKQIIPEEGRSIQAKVQSTVDKTIELSDQLLAKGPDGWKEIVVDHDEALLTGLVQRLDLMNQRGELADAWRQIKLAGDDLRSIVDLQATHVLRTKSNGNDPFDFSFDDSETRLSVALDTPLNRRLQRNNFRLALINYHVGLRNLMAAEDSIKLDVREDLRQLALDRNQYTIAVASASLAYERVISTRLRLQFAAQNVAARDFLEAQQAYTNALLAIARQHVNYITDRTELFFDLEAFDVDRCGYWSGVTEDEGPMTNTDFPSSNPRPYDWLPPRVWYSPTIRQMEQIGPGEAIVYPNQP